MSKINLKTDYEDGQVLHGDELNVDNEVTQLGVNDNFDRITQLSESKADLDYIDTQLSKKVDVTEYNTEIALLDGTKASKAEVALKANQTEVDTKASLDYVNTQLATKASTSYVNAQLDTKANIGDVLSGLNLKEDKTTIGDLDDLTTEVKTSIVDAINSIGVIETPIATTSVAGKVKPDGETITVDQDGTIHSVGGGGGGGTTDYSLLTNKPQINSVELSGNKSLSSLGLMSATDINTALNTKADKFTTYSKSDVDSAINIAVSDKADADDVTAALSTKADVATTYNKTAVDDLLSAQASTLNASIATKAPQSTTYTKTEVDTAVGAKADGLSFSNNELQLKSGSTLIGSPVELNIVGNEVEISTTQPTDPDNKLWINPNEVSNLGTEVVNNVTGDETTKAPSVRAIKNYVDAVDTKNDYSTTEKVVGKWIDGKPLYRKVLQGSYSTIGNAAFTIVLNVNASVDTIINFKALINDSSIPNYYTNAGEMTISGVNYQSTIYFDKFSNKVIVGLAGKGSSATVTVIAIVEYTKTTD